MVLILCSNHTDEKALFLPLHWFFSLFKMPLYFFEEENPTIYPSRPKTNVAISEKFSLFPETGLVILSAPCSITLCTCSKGTHMSSFLKDKCCVTHYLFIWSLAQFLTYSKHSINVNFYHHQQQNTPCNF